MGHMVDLQNLIREYPNRKQPENLRMVEFRCAHTGLSVHQMQIVVIDFARLYKWKKTIVLS